MKRWAERADYEGILAITDSKKKTYKGDYNSMHASRAISFDPSAMRMRIEEEEQRQEMEK